MMLIHPVETSLISQQYDTAFSASVLEWAAVHGRHDLPWQNPRNAYRVWVSEIMLQQTQVERVKDFFCKFITRFPSLEKLAAAESADVMPYWAGLGYYARARNMHKTARILLENGQTSLPDSIDALVELPGIGRSTAGAIKSLGHGLRGVILDGNVKRVLCRYAGIREWPGRPSALKELWIIAEALTPVIQSPEYNQAMMDLGATLCTRRRPACERCPVQPGCKAYAAEATDTIPATRPKRDRPVRHRFVLLARSDSATLLQARPERGLWGGLWSLPESSLDADAAQATTEFAAQLECDTKALTVLPESITHDFTHFRLLMTPIVLKDSAALNAVSVAELDRSVWHDNDAVLKLALPAPISKLLQPNQIRRIQNDQNGSMS